MTRISRFARMAVAVALLGLVSQFAWAHTHVIDEQPGDGEVLEQAPERIGIQFDAPLRITQFEVTGPQGAVEWSEDPVGSMSERHEGIPASSLAPGEYRVEWRGIAEDGHTMSGDYRFTIEE